MSNTITINYFRVLSVFFLKLQQYTLALTEELTCLQQREFGLLSRVRLLRKTILHRSIIIGVV